MKNIELTTLSHSLSGMLYLWQETLLPHLSILVEYSCDVDCILILKWSGSGSVVSDSLQPHRLYSPWNSPGQNTETQVKQFANNLRGELWVKYKSYGSQTSIFLITTELWPWWWLFFTVCIRGTEKYIPWVNYSVCKTKKENKLLLPPPMRK